MHMRVLQYVYYTYEGVFYTCKAFTVHTCMRVLLYIWEVYYAYMYEGIFYIYKGISMHMRVFLYIQGCFC